MTLLERLLSRRRIIDKTGCWQWTGAIFKATGYGQIKVKGQHSTTVHRVMAQLTFGPSKLYACHTCDNRLCFNPAHLFYGSAQENMLDASRKGRTAAGVRNGAWTHPECRPRGEAVGNSVLTPTAVREIRRRYSYGIYGLKRLARDFNTSSVNVLHIVRRDTWRHIEAES